jgi:hypothetical protein
MPYLPIEADNANNFLNTGLARRTITKISFSRLFPQCDAPIDISYNKFNGVKACVDGTELTIGEPAGVIANPQNSKYLFHHIGYDNTDASQFDFSYFNASKTKNMSYIFYYANLPAGFTMPDGFGLSALDLQYAFYSIKGRGDIILPAGFGGLATNMYNMFAFTGAGTQAPYLLDNIYFPEGFGAEVTDIGSMFEYVWMNGSVILPSGFANKAIYLRSSFALSKLNKLILPKGFGENIVDYWNMSEIFDNATINNLHISDGFVRNCDGLDCSDLFGEVIANNSFYLPDDFAANATNMRNMFSEAILPDGFSLPKNFAKDAVIPSYGMPLFQRAEFLGTVNISDGVLANQTNLYNIFSGATFDAGLTIPDNFAPNATSLQYMFGNARFLGPLTIGSGFGQNATDVSSLFSNAEFSSGVELPAGLGQAATNMDYMFSGVRLSGDIDWSGTDLTASAATKANMFNNTTWNGYFMLAQNQTSVDWLIDGTGADATNVKVKGS